MKYVRKVHEEEETFKKCRENQNDLFQKKKKEEDREMEVNK